MKVVKQGKPHKAWTRRVTCTGAGNGNEGCGAELEVTYEDIYATHSSHYDGSSESYLTICCPCCGAETDLSRDTPNYHRIEPLGNRPSKSERDAIKHKYMRQE